MKNKILAILAAAVVGVASFSPVMTAKAMEAPCYKCGEYSIIDEVIGHKYEKLGIFSPCCHGHDGYADNLTQCWDLVRHYCGDCDIHWEDWETSGVLYFCTFDGEYHVY